MKIRRSWKVGLACLAGLTWTVGAAGQTPNQAQHAVLGADKVDKARAAAAVPLHEVPERFRPGVKTTLDKPTLFTQGPVETFACDPAVYHWLLDHPDRGVVAWRRLGAQCVGIADRGAGRFGWTDEHGSELQWETIYQSRDRRIWYAEGKVRPAPLMPLVPVKAIVALHFAEHRTAAGGKVIQHQADMFLYTDSVGATLATKLLGPAGPKMAEQCVAQMQTFFGGLAGYLHRHPERTATLFANDNW